MNKPKLYTTKIPTDDDTAFFEAFLRSLGCHRTVCMDDELEPNQLAYLRDTGYGNYYPAVCLRPYFDRLSDDKSNARTQNLQVPHIGTRFVGFPFFPESTQALVSLSKKMRHIKLLSQKSSHSHSWHYEVHPIAGTLMFFALFDRGIRDDITAFLYKTGMEIRVTSICDPTTGEANDSIKLISIIPCSKMIKIRGQGDGWINSYGDLDKEDVAEWRILPRSLNDTL